MEIFNIKYHHLLLLIMQSMCILKCVNSETTEGRHTGDDMVDSGRVIRQLNQHNTVLDKLTILIHWIKLGIQMLQARTSIHVEGPGLCERSLCPWNITVHRDPDRIPEYINRAECLTTECQFPYPSIRNLLETTCEEKRKGKNIFIF